jgi:hypothetical protein
VAGGGVGLEDLLPAGLVSVAAYRSVVEGIPGPVFEPDAGAAGRAGEELDLDFGGVGGIGAQVPPVDEPGRGRAMGAGGHHRPVRLVHRSNARPGEHGASNSSRSGAVTSGAVVGSC